MTDTWQDFRDRLNRELTALPANASLVVAEPDPSAQPAPKRPWWRLWGSEPQRDAGRYVQVLSFGDVLRAECVSGAYRDVSAAQHQQLLDLGWSDPATHAARYSSDNYVYEAPVAEAAGLAELCTRSLQVLDAQPDVDWRWQVIDD